MSDADTLRHAAFHIRERALVATPGPWEAYDANEGMSPPRPLWSVANDAFHNPGAEDEPWIAVNVETGDKADAEHIASWHPQVALAVADWLDQYADLYESSRHRNRPVFGDHEHAMALARAYLGEQS